MEDSLRRAALEGNISDLYAVIQEDGNVLKRFDKVEFIDTPLHIAANAGRTKFAREIMSLKPSYTRKLNPQGLTPLHIAVEKEHKELVLLLLENDKGLVRVKGKNGETPLHYLITREKNFQLLLLPRFLDVCHESIRDMTTENETALHIAVRNKKEEALKILCKMVLKTNYGQDIVNQQDENGDTVLHIVVRSNQHQMIKLLLKCKADKHATNKDGFTALGVAKQLTNRESISILRGCYIPRVSPFMYKLQKQIVKYVTKASLLIFHDMDNISIEERSALLVVLGLLLTATYQACLSPPGSVSQEDCEDPEKNKKVTAGESVMDEGSFLLFYVPTSVVFIVTFFLTLGLLKPFPRGFRTALEVLLSFLAISFYQSLSFLAPLGLAITVINVISGLLFILMMFMCFAYRVSKFGVLTLGCWLFSTFFDLLNFYAVTPISEIRLITLGNSIVGCFLFLFLYDEFWKGTILVLGYCVFFGLGYALSGSSYYYVVIPIGSVLGCWLFLNLCRFCVKRCIQSRDA